jgi:type IV secretory pathway VirB2 component (pilin)
MPALRAQSSSSNALATPLLLALALAIATALRIPGLFTDFWGDEIWSWHIAGQLHSIAGILFAEPARIDNNHPLNTLWLYLVGQNQPVWLYRLPALLAGTGSVLMAVRIMLRLGTAEAVIGGLLVTFNYPLIFYSSEARGYSICVFLSLLSFDLLQSALSGRPKPDRISELGFGICTLFGFLAHLTFLNVYIAGFVWSLVRVRQLERTTSSRLTRLIRLHAIPAMGLLLLFHFFVGQMVYGGAAPTSPAAVILQSLSLTLGGPEAGPVALLVSIIAGGLFISGLILLARRGSAAWVFFLFAVVLAPAMICTRALVFTDRPQPLMLRYFLTAIAMLLLCIAPVLASLWKRGHGFRFAVAVALTSYIAGSSLCLASFLEMGRGHYADALTQIAEQTQGRAMELASDNPIRTRRLTEFYGPRIVPASLVTVTEDPQSWLILNRAQPTAASTVNYKNCLYTLTRCYPSGDLSGWTWLVYRQKVASTN